MIGVLYVPPDKSGFFNEDDFISLDHEISRMCSNHKFTVLIGDVNARTATLPDFVTVDNFLAET